MPFGGRSDAENPEFSGVFRLPEPRAAADGDFFEKFEQRGYFSAIFLNLYDFRIIIWLVKK
jgi:hypothetical protein